MSRLGAREASDGAIFDKLVSLNITVTASELVLSRRLRASHEIIQCILVFFALFCFVFRSLSQTDKAEPWIEAGTSASGLCLCWGKDCFTAAASGASRILSSVTLIMTLTYTLVRAFMEQTSSRLKTQNEWGRVCSRVCHLNAWVYGYSVCVTSAFQGRGNLYYPDGQFVAQVAVIITPITTQFSHKKPKITFLLKAPVSSLICWQMPWTKAGSGR